MHGFRFEKKAGFTLIELVVVMIIFTTLLGLASINLLNSQDTVNIESTLNVLINDIKSQQNQAMIGSTSGDTPSSYGIFFESGQYTLFKGPTYSGSSPYNHTIELPSSLSFTSIGFPSGIVLFSLGSGEVQDFTVGQNSIILTNTNGGGTESFSINKYGVVDQVN